VVKYGLQYRPKSLQQQWTIKRVNLPLVSFSSAEELEPELVSSSDDDLVLRRPPSFCALSIAIQNIKYMPSY
jgi:hypothetical protein